MKNSISIAALSVAVAWGGYALSDFAGMVPHSSSAAVISVPRVEIEKPDTVSNEPKYLTREEGRTHATDSSIMFSWVDVTGNELGYEVSRSTSYNFIPGTISIVQLPENATSYEDTTVDPGTVYYYKVRAILASNPPTYSRYSDVVYGWIEGNGKSKKLVPELEQTISDEEVY